MRSTIPRPALEAEWLAIRHRYWNASEAAVLAGEHPFLSMADVAVRKITGITDASTSAMRRGQHLEEAIASWWSEEHGVAVYEPGELYRYGDVLATLDRRLLGCETDVLEIKTTARHISEPEPYWWWQCQAQCACAGLERVHLAVLDASMDLQSFTVEADMWAMSLIVELAAKAMSHIREGRIPPDAVLEYRHLEKLHPRPIVASVELGDDIAEQVAELARIRANKRALELAEEDCKTVIAEALTNAASGVWEGQEIVTWRAVIRHNIDASRLRKEHPEIHRQYLTQSNYRTMRVLRDGGQSR